MTKGKHEVNTNKRYSLFVRGELTLNWDDLEFLEKALITVQNTHGTYIQYNENGTKFYEEAKRWTTN